MEEAFFLQKKMLVDHVCVVFFNVKHMVPRNGPFLLRVFKERWRRARSRNSYNYALGFFRIGVKAVRALQACDGSKIKCMFSTGLRMNVLPFIQRIWKKPRVPSFEKNETNAELT